MIHPISPPFFSTTVRDVRLGAGSSLYQPSVRLTVFLSISRSNLCSLVRGLGVRVRLSSGGRQLPYLSGEEGSNGFRAHQTSLSLFPPKLPGCWVSLLPINGPSTNKRVQYRCSDASSREEVQCLFLEGVLAAVAAPAAPVHVRGVCTVP